MSYHAASYNRPALKRVLAQAMKTRLIIAPDREGMAIPCHWICNGFAAYRVPDVDLAAVLPDPHTVLHQPRQAWTTAPTGTKRKALIESNHTAETFYKMLLSQITPADWTHLLIERPATELKEPDTLARVFIPLRASSPITPHLVNTFYLDVFRSPLHLHWTFNTTLNAPRGMLCAYTSTDTSEEELAAIIMPLIDTSTEKDLLAIVSDRYRSPEPATIAAD